jgi:hypothetical protein
VQINLEMSNITLPLLLRLAKRKALAILHLAEGAEEAVDTDTFQPHEVNTANNTFTDVVFSI